MSTARSRRLLSPVCSNRRRSAWGSPRESSSSAGPSVTFYRLSQPIECVDQLKCLAADRQFHRHLPTQFPVFPQAGELFADDDVRRESAAFNATLQIGYFIIGVRAAGLSAGPMSGFDADAVSREFLPEGHRALCVMNIGWPAEHAWSGRLPRLRPEQVFTTV